MMGIDWGRLSPRFWLQNYRTDWEWDKMLNDLLDRYEPKPGYCTITLGDVEVWAENFPYSYGAPYRPGANVLPSTATRKRLRAAIPKPDPLAEVRSAVLLELAGALEE